MRDAQPRKLQIYKDSSEREPFTEWFTSIRDRTVRVKIQKRLVRLKSGNFGDCRSVGGGVFELRLHFGAGYRIYFSEVDNVIVLVLCGGDKSSQTQDIKRAKDYWQEYKETQS